VHPQLKCRYSTRTAEEALQDNRTLAVIGFEQTCQPSRQARFFNTGLMHLNNNKVIEVWTSETRCMAGVDNEIHWSRCENYQFSGLWVDEANYSSLKDASYHAYLKLLSFIEKSNYPHIMRAWNYLADINSGSNDDERYKQFCAGRCEAFEKLAKTNYPAATAIGHQGGHMIIYLLTSNHPVMYFENPRQTSAYHYPRQYGPKTPSFSRAACLNSKIPSQHYISGTASIVGHESIGRGDVVRQIEVTNTNLKALCQQITDKRNYDTPAELSMIKVYLRNPALIEQTQYEVERHFGLDLPALYLQGDICREELLIEIDALSHD